VSTPPSTRTDHDGNEYELRAVGCPICGRDDARLLGLRGGKHQRYGLGFESRIYRCRGCGLIYPNPLPIPKDPSSLYSDPEEYFRQHDPERKQEGAEWMVREIIDRTGSDRPAILDIGSGRGEILWAAGRLGCPAVGLELSEPMIEYARDHLGVSVRPVTVEKLAAEQPADSFDGVVAGAVLEHVYDPDSFIRAVARLLRPGGVLFLDTPREPNLMTWVATTAERIRGRPTVYYLAPSFEPFHLYGFNPRAVRALLAKHGFSIEELHVRAKPLIQARSGDRRDAVRALIGRQLVRIGNLTRSATNLDLWARASGSVR
jgi:2-polyprenyl-3-methyl-5-hydroxy-6-metoxy-1,4-benzoquinol methylase